MQSFFIYLMYIILIIRMSVFASEFLQDPDRLDIFLSQPDVGDGCPSVVIRHAKFHDDAGLQVISDHIMHEFKHLGVLGPEDPQSFSQLHKLHRIHCHLFITSSF